MELVATLHRLARRERPLEIGCIRRNVMMRERDAFLWREQRGGALLRLLDVAVIDREGLLNVFEVDCYEDHLIFFRAGPWQDYWRSDFNDIYALIVHNNSLWKPAGIYLVWENNGVLTQLELPVPDNPLQLYANLQERVGTYQLGKGTPPRIAKDGPRGGGCHYCPFKAACDATDRAEGATDDWPKTYTRGPAKMAQSLPVRRSTG